MWGLSLKQMCTVLTPKRYPGYSRSVLALLQCFHYWTFILPHLLPLSSIKSSLLNRISFQFWHAESKAKNISPLSRSYTPMKAKVKRNLSFLWSPSERSPATSATRVTSSFPHSTTSPPTAKRAPSRCGTCSSHRLLWSADAATSSATRTTWTRRRRSLLPAKVGSTHTDFSGLLGCEN